MEWVDLWQLLQLKTLMIGHGGSSAGLYLTDPTSPIPSHCAVIILFKSVSVHQLLWQALLRVTLIIPPTIFFLTFYLHSTLTPPTVFLCHLCINFHKGASFITSVIYYLNYIAVLLPITYCIKKWILNFVMHLQIARAICVVRACWLPAQKTQVWFLVLKQFQNHNGVPQAVLIRALKVPYGFQSICKQTCKHLVRCTLHNLMYMLIFSQSNS